VGSFSERDHKPLEVMNLKIAETNLVVTDLVSFQASVRDRRAWKAWSGPVLLFLGILLSGTASLFGIWSTA
jgi:hypothetical protein